LKGRINRRSPHTEEKLQENNRKAILVVAEKELLWLKGHFKQPLHKKCKLACHVSGKILRPLSMSYAVLTGSREVTVVFNFVSKRTLAVVCDHSLHVAW
jgi:hypothetical protein